MPQKIIMKFFLLLSMALLFVACPGNDGNVVDTTRYTSIDTGGTSPDGTTPEYSYTVADINQYFMAQAPSCESGARLADLNVINVDTISATSIYASGSQNSGLLTKKVVSFYVGESYSKDVIVVCKTSDDKWNVMVSFCPYRTWVPEGSTPLEFETGSLGAKIELTTVSSGTVYAKDTLIKINDGSTDRVFGPTSFYQVSFE